MPNLSLIIFSLVCLLDIIIVIGLKPFKKAMKFYITMFNACVIQTLVTFIYYLNTVDENELELRYEIGGYIYSICIF